jgi:hypothetical protein
LATLDVFNRQRREPVRLQTKADSAIQVMYTLADERVMYVPPVVRTKLLELGIQLGEPFTICKAEREEGNRRFIEWH